MSDIKLFRLIQDQATELQGDASKFEKPLQSLTENNDMTGKISRMKIQKSE